MQPAPIVLFVYNRPEHTKKTLKALQQNKLASKSDLYIYADAQKHEGHNESVHAVRDYIQTIDGFKSVTIIEREKNWGLADSIVDGVTAVVNQYGRVIVLEDDIVTSPNFLQFMNEALELYKDEEHVMHISGYFLPVDTTGLPETFFYNHTSCWGWATWDRAWSNYCNDAAALLRGMKQQKRLREFDLDGAFRFSSTLRANAAGRQKTWAVKWSASVFLERGYCLHPKQSFVQNIGTDGSGNHEGVTNSFQHAALQTKVPELSKLQLTENTLSRSLAAECLGKHRPTLLSRLRNVLKLNR